MSLLGIIETLRRNLKGVIVACWVLLGLLVVADVARIVTGFGHHAAAAEHTVAPAAEQESHAAASEHSAHAEHAASAEHSGSLKSEISDLKSAPHGAQHGFWATAYHIAENVPVFWTLFGFVGCVVIVVVSKSYGHFGVSVKEDYYGE